MLWYACCLLFSNKSDLMSFWFFFKTLKQRNFLVFGNEIILCIQRFLIQEERKIHHFLIEFFQKKNRFHCTKDTVHKIVFKLTSCGLKIFFHLKTIYLERFTSFLMPTDDRQQCQLIMSLSRMNEKKILQSYCLF